MAPHEKQSSSMFTHTAISIVMITVGVFACAAATVVGIDAACYEYNSRWVPIYPSATVVEMDFDFIRPQGMGNTYMVYETADERLDVQDWYIQQRARAGSSQGIGSAGFQVVDHPDGEGSLIRLYSSCAWT